MSGTQSRGDIAVHLSTAGLRARRHVVYAQNPCLLPDAAQSLIYQTPVLVPLFSPAAAAHFSQQIKCAAGLYVAPISQAAADEITHLPYAACQIASTPDAPGLAKSLHILSDSMLSG